MKQYRSTLLVLGLASPLSVGCMSHELASDGDSQQASDVARVQTTRSEPIASLPEGLRLAIQQRVEQAHSPEAAHKGSNARSRSADWDQAAIAPSHSASMGLVNVGGGPSTKVYYIGDLIRTPRSFPGRPMDIAPSGALRESDEELLESAPIVTGSQLEELIRAVIDPDSWDEDGNSIQIRGDKLIVRRK
ncbi:MAG: hypothetical protein ACI841_004947 [Planctomycetota bacterium]|jgi:hypothetical protein